MFDYHFTLRLWSAMGLVLFAALPVQAERPSAPALLPADTLVMVRVANMPDLREKLKDTAAGRMLQDPEIAPLADNLWASLAEWWSEIEDRVGVPLDDLRMTPQGEICFAVVPQGDRMPSVVMLLDVKDRLRTAQILLEKAEEAMNERGLFKSTEIVGDVRCSVFKDNNDRVRMTYFEKEGTLVFASRLEAVQQIVEDWSGTAAEPRKHLSDNERFAVIMNRCRGSKDESPQITWYVDPVSLTRTLARGNTAAQTSLALIPVLGIDGLQGIGGSVILGSGEFDQITHVHVLLENPRSGVLELLTLNEGDTSPEPWVPDDASSYMTVHWDLNRMYRQGAKLYNSFTEDGALEKEVQERLKEVIDLDFEMDLLAAYGGRATMFTWIEKPYRLNSQSIVIGVKLTDAKAFEATLEKIMSRDPERADKVAYGSISYYRVKTPENPPENENAPPRELLRQPTPCIGIVGDYVIFTDGEEAFLHALEAQKDPEKQLSSQLDYKLIASKIKRQNGGESAGMVSFNRPEEGLRMIYEVARGETAKGQIDRLADEGNRPFSILKKAFDDHPLPPFSKLEQYFAPGGSMVTDEETGYHFMGFQLKREKAE